MFDAILIEHAFARLLGDPIDQRRDLYDAGVFRSGDPQHLGRLIEVAAKWLEERLDQIAFAREESRDAGARTRLNGAIKWLRSHGAEMKNTKEMCPESVSWSIIGDLIEYITALLDHMEGKGAGTS